MATVYWKEVETWIKRWNEYESIFNLVNGVHDAGAEALIRRVEGLEKRILYVLKCPDSNLCRTCIVQLNEALKEEPDSVG